MEGLERQVWLLRSPQSAVRTFRCSASQSAGHLGGEIGNGFGTIRSQTKAIVRRLLKKMRTAGEAVVARLRMTGLEEEEQLFKDFRYTNVGDATLYIAERFNWNLLL